MAAIVVLWFGCFDGAGALGYPCETDDDCGPSLACEDTGCCGGSCLFGSEGGTQSTSTGTSTETTTGSSSTTIDPSSESSSSSSSSSGEPLPECGNGLVEDGEECDLGDRNEMGVFVACNQNCRAALFHFDSAEQDDGDFCQGGCAPWVLEGGDEGAWVSGPYPLDPVVYQLVSRRFTIPNPPADRVPVMRFAHDFDFSDCELVKGMPEYFDGGHVMLMDSSDALTHLSPVRGEGHAHEPSCIGSDTPWCTGSTPPMIYGGNGDGPITRLVPIPEESWGEEVQLVFELGFDTMNCISGNPGRDPDPWRILEVVVALDAA